jgi:tRNA threonylcarbamoyladenosine biosynthesis protein TsaE
VPRGKQPGNGGDRVWITRSAEETRDLAESLGRLSVPGDVVLLEGPLGAGKTCFVQGLARGLGAKTAIKSPTFVLVSRHEGRVPLFHVDLYRVDGSQSLDELGLDENREDSLLAVEWGEKIEDRIEDGLRIDLLPTEEGRRITACALGPAGHARLTAWTSRIESEAPR